MVKRRYNRYKKKEKARRSSNVRTHAEMQKGLEPRDTKRVWRLGLSDNRTVRKELEVTYTVRDCKERSEGAPTQSYSPRRQGES